MKMLKNYLKLKVPFVSHDLLVTSLLGMSWTKRKIASKLTPTINFSFPNKETLKIQFSTSVMSRTQEYKINGITKHKG